MYKKLLLLPLGILILLTLHSCKKDRNNDTIENRSGDITFAEAQAFFETQVLPNSKLSMAIKNSSRKLSTKEILSDEKTNDLLYKEPVWDKAYTKKVDNGTALAIPIHFQVKSYLPTGPGIGINFERLNYLLITKSKEGALRAEWVTLHPDMTWIRGDRQIYTGRAVVSDWDGNVKRRIKYDSSGKATITEVSGGQRSFSSSTLSPFKGAVTESYKTPDGKCYENIRQVQDPNGPGVILYRKEVACDDEDAKTKNNPFTGTGPDKTSNSGGGGGGGDPYLPKGCDPDPGNTKPANNQPYLVPCDQTKPFIIEEPIVFEKEESPCDNAKSLGKDEAFKNMISTLEDLTNEKNERGFTYKINPDGSFTKTELAGKDGEAGIGFSVDSPIDGYAHTHYTGLLSIFSGSDIYAITELYKSNKIPINFTATVVTASGTKYMLKIEDVLKFYDFANSVRGAGKNIYETMYGKLYNISPTNSVEANEKAFLQYLDMTKSGLKLFKANPATGTWEPKKVDAEGNIVNNPC